MLPKNPEKATAVLLSLLAKVKPGSAETARNFEVAQRLIRKLEGAVPAGVEVRLAGSLAKGTNLSGNNEFDLFMLFPRHCPHGEMTSLGLSCAKKAFSGMKTEVRYAEHPYLKLFFRGYHADVVPAYKISGISEKGSSVDRSQLHTEYINEKLDGKAKDDVRLLKRFMKNFGIYGAELRVEGFSGYLCELLIAHYGSLLKLMEAASSWHEPALDAEKRHSHEQMRAAFDSPLVVLDPVDARRNVAAVVARTSLSRFMFECRRFLASPSKKFFFSEKKGRSASEITRAMRERGTRCLALRFPAPNAVPDVLWPQLKKTAQALARRLEALEFSVFGCYHWSDGKECVVFFELDRWSLPAIRKAVGPKIRFERDVEAFILRHRGCINLHLEHDRVVAVERRKVSDAGTALATACRSPAGLGVPESMEKAMRRHSILEGRDAVRAEYLGFLADYFFVKIA